MALVCLRFLVHSNAWLANVGITSFFVSMGSLTIAVSALGLPVWVFGKVMRRWADEHSLVKYE